MATTFPPARPGRVRRQLTRRYAVILAGLGIVATAGEVAIQYHLGRLENDGTEINYAGRQRMLSQRIALAAATGGGGLLDAAELQGDVAEWTAVHSALLGTGGAPGVPEVTDPAARAALDSLTDDVERVAGATQALTEARAAGDSAAAAAAAAAVVAGTRAFLPGMDRVVFASDAATAAETARLRTVAWSVWLAVVGLGGLLTWAVFRPAVAEAEAAVEEARRQGGLLRAVIDHLPVVVFATDADGRFTLSEGHGLAALGRRPGESVGQIAFDLYDDPTIVDGLRRVLDGEPTRWRAEVNGTVWKTHAAPRLGPDGRPIGILGAAFEVTALEGAKRQLAQTAAQLERVLGATPDAIVFADADRRIEYANPAFEGTFGYPADELTGRPTSVLYADPAAFEEQGRVRFSPSAAPDAPSVVRYRRRDGSEFVGETTGAPIRDEAGAVAGYVGVIRDVTAREEALAAADRQRARYERLVEHAADLIYQLGPDGRLTFANAATLETLGYSEADLLGRHFADLLPDDSRDDVVAFYQDQLDRGEPATDREVAVVARDGSTVWLEQSVVLAERPSADADGTVRAEFHVVARDVTERRRVQAQLRAAREAADAALAAKETFLANVSHEMRTPLHAVTGLARLLAAGPVSASQTDLVHGITRAADALLALINDLLDRARLDAGAVEIAAAPFFLADVLADVRHILTPVAAEKGVGLEVEAPDAVDALLGDPQRLRQVLLNLTGNALKFTDEGRVRVRAVVEDRSPTVVRVRFEVEDTGIGIPAHQQGRIFEAFAQVRDDAARVHGGTGLGLSIVRSLAEAMGGTAAVESAPGEGSTFSVTVPFDVAVGHDDAPGGDGLAATAGAAGPVDLGGLRVLLVEDNPTNRFIARTQLEAWGAEVTEAASGQEGLDRLAEPDRAADVVLMDLQMPGMDGIEATRRIRGDLGLGPAELPVIALTASALAARRGTTAAAGFDDFVLKPFEPDDLRRRIGLLVGRAAPRPSDVEGLIDLDRFRTSTLGDPELERQVARLFLDEALARATDIVGAAAARDAGALRAAAHALKGQALYVGAARLVAALEAAETVAEAALAGTAPDGAAPAGPVDLVEAAERVAVEASDATWALRVLYPPTRA